MPQQMTQFSIETIPHRVREIATLRGLGYSFREIASRTGTTPQAASVILTRYRRSLEKHGCSSDLTALSARAANVLDRLGISSKEEARRANLFEKLGRQRNCGHKTLQEIREWIANDGDPFSPASSRAEDEIMSFDGNI